VAAARLFDHLVGAGDDRRRYGEADHSCSSQVDNEFELNRRLHWQISRLFALKDTINVVRRSPHEIDGINAVRQQAAFDGLATVRIDCGQRVPRGQKNNKLTMHRVEGIRHYDQAPVRLARQRAHGALNRWHR
jgi:hypothetical protein